MKQFFTLALIAGALMVSAPSQALVASKAQCVSTCDGHGSVNTNCGWITKPGKFHRCRTRLIKQCRKFGTDVMCPAPPPLPAPPAPVVTTTTTTLPYVPPTTTTTLPVVVITYPNLLGAYEFEGTLVSDPCGIGLGATLNVGFTVTSQVGTSLSGVVGVAAFPAIGDYDPSTDGWNLGCTDYDTSSGCTFQASLGIGSSYIPNNDGYLIVDGTCDGLTCEVQYSGPVL
jgi:hypothetical protein